MNQFITVIIVHNEQKNVFLACLSTLLVRIVAVLQREETSGIHCSSNLRILKKLVFLLFKDILA